MALVVDGRGTGAIGAKLRMASKTVEAHLRRAVRSTRLQSRTELATRALREGWLDIPQFAVPTGEWFAPRLNGRRGGGSDRLDLGVPTAVPLQFVQSSGPGNVMETISRRLRSQCTWTRTRHAQRAGVWALHRARSDANRRLLAGGFSIRVLRALD